MIQNYLDISTAHLPGPNPDWKGIRVVKHNYGFIAFVAPDLKDVPDWLKETFDFANALNCSIISFDPESEIIERLPQWNWK